MAEDSGTPAEEQVEIVVPEGESPEAINCRLGNVPLLGPEEAYAGAAQRRLTAKRLGGRGSPRMWRNVGPSYSRRKIPRR